MSSETRVTLCRSWLRREETVYSSPCTCSDVRRRYDTLEEFLDQFTLFENMPGPA